MTTHIDVQSPQISFQTRIRSRESLPAMGARVGAALGLTFAPYHDRMYDSGEAYAASALGLNIAISHDPSVPEGEERTYILIGSILDELEVHWPVDPERQSISEYILGVLQVADSPEWYIASKSEKQREAGLLP